MKTGVEIDMIVSDSLAALDLYESIFDLERVEVTSLAKGLNEAVFTIYGVRFHMLDANPEYQMFAPAPGAGNPVWFNVVVPDIQAVWEKAVKAGCTVVQPVTLMEEIGVSNAMFSDSFGYLWMLHQIHREVSFENRVRLMEEQMREHNE
jgi:uncharacterized glyoxalase superfamily protein PhnB